MKQCPVLLCKYLLKWKAVITSQKCYKSMVFIMEFYTHSEPWLQL